MSKPVHNLNIQTYSLEEILGLFDLTNYSITIDQLKQAKKRVLMLHPDKSKLEPKYFLFYKKAFDIVVQFYDNQHRQNQEITAEKVAYDPNHGKSEPNKQMKQTIQKMSSDSFNDKFNELFENNNMGQKQDTSRNEWFQNESSQFDVPQEKMSKQGMNDHFQRIKDQTTGLVQYNGVQTLGHQGGNNDLYNDEDDNGYVASDPFSKLKFDDLRKVHRDQTVLAVSENDIHNIQTYGSVEEFNRARSQHSYDPLEKEHANRLLHEQEKAMQENIMRKEYQSKLQSEQYAEKNKQVMSSFLLLQNNK